MAADGGMIGGGIMDAAGRQQYFLGKIVKKATRAVKKIVKSPVGKLGLGALALKFGGLLVQNQVFYFLFKIKESRKWFKLGWKICTWSRNISITIIIWKERRTTTIRNLLDQLVVR